MDIANFDDLLRAAREQPEPQRLLFVFAAAELPEDSTPKQRDRHAAGQGGALVPLMSVDKDPEDLADFEALVRESRRFSSEWSMVFVAGLSGRAGRAPTSDEADRSLQRMIESVRTGRFGSYIPFDRQGRPVVFA